ncbi:hypothetical protein VNO78_27879 [Psophocarpus tetragonolobus]|uniref:Fe2OG dioxygenase domain-containing protein n=1 Tax=Psophocarpus tetragonolobus TaxID=3891 RepID=A0AAN9XBR8_PSOTE
MKNIESYPPVLRQVEEERGGKSEEGMEDDADGVPIIDLEWLEDEQEWNKLDEACKDWGLFRLVNHGVPFTLLKHLQDLAKQLFCLSFEAKQAACIGTPLTYFWGTPALTPSRTPLTRGPQNMNFVEGFDLPFSHLPHLNPQLPTLHSIRLLLTEYERHLSRIAKTIFEAMAKRLELKVEGSKSYIAENTGMVRVYRYPNCSDTNVGWGMEAHTDSSVLSILNQDDEVSGLQILKDDQWLTVKPISNTLIVNLGDMMQAISNDRYKSVTHRVSINKHKERISICYFVFPGEDVVIESSKYKPFTYNEFRAQVQQDIKSIGHKIGLPRFLHYQDS